MSLKTLVSLGCALGLSILLLPSATAAGAPAPQPMADKAPSLPLTATFEKAKVDGNDGYVLNLKNVSEHALTVTATIVPSVTFHANAKAHTLPAHGIDPGAVWTIGNLAAMDKVSLAANGFETMDLTVP